MSERLEVFVTSPWVPPEWIQAHGLKPRGAWFGETKQPSAVPEGVCGFARRLADLAGAHPEAAFVFTTACDQLRRAADAARARAHPRVFLFNLPATWQSSTARRLYHAELTRLGRFLETLGGCSPTDVELEDAIASYESHRESLRRLLLTASARPALEALAELLNGLTPGLPRGGGSAERRDSPPRTTAALHVPLALVGGPLLPAQWALFDAIESVGGSVVLNATEPGERTLLPPLPLTPRCAAGTATRRSELLASLANHYFDHAVDVFHRPNTRLYDWLRPRLSERGVRGIVLWVHAGCDLWRAEAASLREAFALPVLVLEAHEVHAGGLRDTNRLAAFIESLQPSLQNFVAPATESCTSAT